MSKVGLTLNNLLMYYTLAATPRPCGVKGHFATANLHIEHSMRGLNRNVAILLTMQIRSREATVTTSTVARSCSCLFLF